MATIHKTTTTIQSTSNNYTQDNLKLATVHTRQIRTQHFQKEHNISSLCKTPYYRGHFHILKIIFYVRFRRRDALNASPPRKSCLWSPPFMEYGSSLPCLQEPTTVMVSHFNPVPIITIGKCPFINPYPTNVENRVSS